jgi:hypothetical protein
MLYSSQCYSGATTTSVFSWWQNITLEIATEKIVSGVSSSSDSFDTDDLVNITIQFNNTDENDFNTTYIDGALLVEVKDSSGSLSKIFAIDTTLFTSSGQVNYSSYTNDFSGLSAGTYTIFTRLVYGYPEQNITLINQSFYAINASTNVTVTVVPPPSTPDTPSGGGGGGGGTTTSKKYAASIHPTELNSGDIAKLYLNITNTNSDQLETNVKIYIMKNSKIINEIDKDITTPGNENFHQSIAIFESACNSAQGEYDVKVEFYESSSVKKTEDLSFTVLECKKADAKLSTGKTVYYPDEEANIMFEIKNIGNIDLNGNVEIILKNNSWQATLANITSVKIEQGNTYTGEIRTAKNRYTPGLYTLQLQYRNKEIFAETSTTLLFSEMAATVVNIMVWLIIIAMIVLAILAALELYKGGKEVVKVYKDQN